MAYHLHALRPRDAWLPASLWAVIFGAGIYLGHADEGWLVGGSVVVICLVALIFREAHSNARYGTTVAIFIAVHIAVIHAAFLEWHSFPVKALTPLFTLDFIAMSLLFPKLSRLSFED